MRFIGVDGEAIDGRYCLLQAGNTDPLINLDGLSTEDCLSYLASLPRGYIYVGYSLTYDIENWLRDLDDYHHSLLRAGFECRWGAYRLRWMRGKIFEVRTDRRRVRIYDLYPFYMRSFVRACELTLGERDDFVARYKSLRGSFTREMLDEIVRYNQTECELMSRIASRIYEEVCYLGLKTVQLYGPSALADKLLRKCNVSRIDDDLFVRAYYGGRFETFRFGHIEGVDSYDINSAYPYSTKFLLTHNGVRRVSYYEGVGIYRVRWESNQDVFGPFPYRTRDRLIVYPRRGDAWLWDHEIEAGRWACARLDIVDGYALIDPRPFKFIYNAMARCYGLRKRMKGTFKEYILKVLMNSVYGKLAQTVGRARRRRLDFASAITARTRAMMLDVVRGRLDRLIAIYTDGVYFRDVQLRNGQSESLGGWKHTRYESGVFVGNGIYVLNSKDGKRTHRIRGFRHVDIDRVLEDLRATGAATVSEKVFVGRGLTRIAELRDKYLQFTDYAKTISLDANRRKRLYDEIDLERECATLALEGWDGPSFEMMLDLDSMYEIAESMGVADALVDV